MEATPSLACANKCVFCWRHHSNPTGTSWTWDMQGPREILDGCLKGWLCVYAYVCVCVCVCMHMGHARA